MFIWWSSQGLAWNTDPKQYFNLPGPWGRINQQRNLSQICLFQCDMWFGTLSDSACGKMDVGSIFDCISACDSRSIMKMIWSFRWQNKTYLWLLGVHLAENVVSSSSPTWGYRGWLTSWSDHSLTHEKNMAYPDLLPHHSLLPHSLLPRCLLPCRLLPRHLLNTPAQASQLGFLQCVHVITLHQTGLLKCVLCTGEDQV